MRDAQAQRDLTPHREARMAMWLWSADYATSGLGSMAYWDSLSEAARNTARRAVAEILRCPPETPNYQVNRTEPRQR